MKYRQLGDSSLEVSEIALGSWLTYGVGVDLSIATECIYKAFDVGINFIDTANIYGTGTAETALGKILNGRPRDSYILATKLFFPMTDSDYGLSATQIHKQMDASLERLNVDFVDLYQCHRYDDDTPLEETMQALSEVVRAGKARYIGFSEWTAGQISAALSLTDSVKFVSSQPQYSMIWREPEDAVIPVCEKNGISQIVWSPLAQGVLTGKYRPNEKLPADSRAVHETMNVFMERARDAELLTAVQNLEPIAADLGISMAQMALAWVLRQNNVASAIIGASRPSQVTENAAASGVKLEQGALTAIDEALAPVL